MIDASSLTPVARELAKMGRHGDTMLAHINPQEAALLKSFGGSGTINPYTGLPEFWNPFKWVEEAVDFVGDALSGVGDAIGDALSSIGDTLGDVVEGLGNVLENVIKNPLPVIATIALTWALGPEGFAIASETFAPVIANAAVAAANGADIENIALAAATSYAGQYIGAQVGLEYTGGVPISELADPTEVVMAKIITSSSTSAATAALQGKPLDQVISAGITSGVTSYAMSEIKAAGYDPKSLPAEVVSKIAGTATAAILNGEDVSTAITKTMVGTLASAGYKEMSSAVQASLSATPEEKFTDVAEALSVTESQVSKASFQQTEFKNSLEDAHSEYTSAYEQYKTRLENVTKLHDFLTGLEVSSDGTHYVDSEGKPVLNPDGSYRLSFDNAINNLKTMSEGLNNYYTKTFKPAEDAFLAAQDKYVTSTISLEMMKDLNSQFKADLKENIIDNFGSDIQKSLAGSGVDPTKVGEYYGDISDALVEGMLENNFNYSSVNKILPYVGDFVSESGSEDVSEKINQMLDIASVESYDPELVDKLLDVSASGGDVNKDFLKFLDDNVLSSIPEGGDLSVEELETLAKDWSEYSDYGDEVIEKYEDLQAAIKKQQLRASFGFGLNKSKALATLEKMKAELALLQPEYAAVMAQKEEYLQDLIGLGGEFILPFEEEATLGDLVDQQQSEDEFYTPPVYEKPDTDTGLDALTPDKPLSDLVDEQQEEDEFYTPPVYDDTEDLTDTFVGPEKPLGDLVDEQQSQDPNYVPPIYDDSEDLTDLFKDEDKDLGEMVDEQQAEDEFYTPPVYDDSEDLTDLFKDEDKTLGEMVDEQQAEDEFYEPPTWDDDEDLTDLFKDETTTGGGGGGGLPPIGGGTTGGGTTGGGTTGGGTTGGGTGTAAPPKKAPEQDWAAFSDIPTPAIARADLTDITAFNPLEGATWGQEINVPTPTFMIQPPQQPKFFDPVDYEDQEYAEGGLVDHNPEFFSEGGASLANRYVKGRGDGTSDSVPAMLASGEFVIPADVVSSLGNGDNDAGAGVLDQFLKVVRKHKRSADPKDLPPDSRGPLSYLSEAQKRAKNGRTK